METRGILVSRRIGRTREYTFKLGHTLLDEPKGLFEKTIFFYCERLQEGLLMIRRPRLRGGCATYFMEPGFNGWISRRLEEAAGSGRRGIPRQPAAITCPK